MKDLRWCTLFVLVLGAATSLADDATSVSKLRDLADGEVRTYGRGDHAITVRRHGEMVTLTIPQDGGASRVLEVDLAGGDGTVTTTERSAADGTAARLVLVKKRQTRGGVSQDVLTASAPGVAAPPVTAAPSFETTGAHAILAFRASDGIVVSCPEGDTAMRLDTGDTATYLCPKHKRALEPGHMEAVVPPVVITDAERKRGEPPLSFETKTIGGDEKKYSGKPLSLDF